MKKLIALYVNAQDYMQSKAKDEEGATMVEYGLMVAFIAIVAMAGATLLGPATDGVLTSLAGTIAG